MCGYTKTHEGGKKTQTVSAEKIDPPTTASDLLFAGGDIKGNFFFIYSLINTMIIIISNQRRFCDVSNSSNSLISENSTQPSKFQSIMSKDMYSRRYFAEMYYVQEMFKLSIKLYGIWSSSAFETVNLIARPAHKFINCYNILHIIHGCWQSSP